MKNLKRRISNGVLLLALGLLLAVAMTGCGGKTTPTAGTPPTPQGDQNVGNIEIEYWNINNETFGGPALAALVDEFNATNDKNITVVNRFIPEAYKGVTTNLQAALASKSYPGIVQMSYSNVEYVSDNFPYSSPEKVISDHFPEDANYIKDNFDDYIVDLGRNGQGELVGMPYSTSNPIMFINEDLFTEAGLDPKDIPETWAEVIEAARVIKEKTGAYGFYLQQATDNWAQQAMMESAGGQLITYEDGKAKATFNTPEVIGAYNQLYEMYNEGLSPQITESEGQAAFAGGQIAMHIMTCGRTTFVKENCEFNWSTSGFPAFEGQEKKIPVGGNMLLVVADTPEKEQASWEFMKFLYEPESLVKWTEGTGYLPPRKGIAENELKAYFEENIALAPALDQLNFAASWASWPGKNGLEIDQVLMDLRDSIISGQAPAADAIKEAEDKINSLL